MIKSAWAQYRDEVVGTQFIEHEQGFISYYHISEDCTFIEDLWVAPDFRKQLYGTQLVGLVENIARKAGKKFLMLDIQMGSKTRTEALKAALAGGFEPFEANNNRLWLKREIKESDNG